jgi:REP element-mobilizing transposase RayT
MCHNGFMDQRRNQDPHLSCHSRKTTRLPGYDYSQPGYYFVTICTHRRRCCLGEVVEGVMRLSELGEVVQDAWKDLPQHYTYVNLDEFVIMPNHVHGIVQIMEIDQITGRGGFLNPPLQQRHDLSEIIRGFKTWSARNANRLTNTPGAHVWQRSFYDHIIRDEDDLNAIRNYIRYNPLKWETDSEYGT